MALKVMLIHLRRRRALCEVMCGILHARRRRLQSFPSVHRVLVVVDFRVHVVRFGVVDVMIVAVSIGVSMITLTAPNFFHSFPSWDLRLRKHFAHYKLPSSALELGP